ncbi:SAM-dependent methyltransferase [Catalinimonas niigatensis]|uniref:SAM-dependent methyltransferase n=1 Tax=Catalinimonas niigatensis TaxID=1397264 RepID=UPI002665A12F|nr:class I SAM-dependent methyltransferase [Catalinimonas niigatensis]WPP51245.1 methyltransferase domain-containing protein [Catalinimonas niigatensis]
MKNTLLKLLNPISWIKAYSYHRKNTKYDKSAYDLELFFYSRILKNDMLHYGYFDNSQIAPEEISIKQFEEAQIRYSENIIAQIKQPEAYVLDVGCGMGGFSGLLLQHNFKVEALTPNVDQKKYINSKYTKVTVHQSKFEDFHTDKKYGTIINSESLQYIRLEQAFKNVERLLLPDGRWIVVDYFQDNEGKRRSPHQLQDFRNKLKEYQWEVVMEQDISLHILPTIKLVYMYAERFLLPLQHLAFEKLRYKKSWLYYLTKEERNSVIKKMEKEIAVVDPQKFLKERKYMFFVLKKKA